MVAFKQEKFGGMLPSLDDRLLPAEAASYSRDAYLYDGTLIGWRAPKDLHNLASPTTNMAYRIPVSLANDAITASSYWVEFDDADTNVIRGPVVDDTFSRYYYASPSIPPTYNTLARIATDDSAWLLGIPKPSSAPSVSPAGGGFGLPDTRSYVYTYVSTYGEEGPPSDALVQNGYTDDTWTIGVTSPDGDDMGVDRNIDKIRIYRTVVSTAGVATYFLVVEISAITTSYDDILSDAIIALNNQLESSEWTGPPSDLAGFILAPNGMLVGFRTNEIWFSEPFRPHAWPGKYVLTTEFPIVGLGVCGQTVVVATDGYPVIVQGISPASATQTSVKTSLPCNSRGSIVSTPNGVYYTSPMGLIFVDPSGAVSNKTKDWIQRDKWSQLTPPVSTRAAIIDNIYFAFGTVYLNPDSSLRDATYASAGFTVDSETQFPQVGFGLLTAPNGALAIDNVLTDPWTGSVMLIQNQKVVYYDFSDTAPTIQPYLWRSKIYQQGNKKNYEVMRIWFDVPTGTPTQNVPRDTTASQPTFPHTPGQYGIVRVYGDGTVFTTREIRNSGELLRILSGQKYEFWQWEFEGIVRISNMQAATAVKDLAEI